MCCMCVFCVCITYHLLLVFTPLPSVFFSLLSSPFLPDIEKFKEEYIGSQAEIVDIKEAFVSSKGDMDTVFSSVRSHFLCDFVRFLSILCYFRAASCF